ncbi:hypothetical protein BT93_L3669 [Corymbia citriodora subsp. variegata]|uniref:Uncharacterized protein n=1 Tax=Corymbia citriodora subsp. variegata TaxID=360336 RepID=A0A8T0CGW4_CORYI|nr:hypothetical protein BT93_L3669 [Corymbia citriodora subsp. variegata]
MQVGDRVSHASNNLHSCTPVQFSCSCSSIQDLRQTASLNKLIDQINATPHGTEPVELDHIAVPDLGQDADFILKTLACVELFDSHDLAACRYCLVNAPKPTFSDALLFTEIIGRLGDVPKCELP